MKSKKSQGISTTTVLVAALALIVLVVLVAVFSGRRGIWDKFDDEMDKCLSEKLYCKYNSNDRWYVINDLSNPHKEHP